MNIKEIQEMIKLMQENEINEFQLERNGFKIILKRGKTREEIISSVSQPQQLTPTEKSGSKEHSNFIEIVSPMVGTFYSSPSPDSAPYVQAGQQIQVGDVVGIVEAMKVMNEIKSEITGSVLEILVESGQPVEYGQPLIKLKP